MTGTRQAFASQTRKSPPAKALTGKTGGPFLTDAEAPVVAIVDADEEKVEADLGGGLFACPDCGRALARWGYSSWRPLRRGAEEVRFRPRRSICRSCTPTCSCLIRVSCDAVTTSR